jgi:hypothetical protein
MRSREKVRTISAFEDLNTVTDVIGYSRADIFVVEAMGYIGVD